MAKLTFNELLHKVEINGVEFLYDPMNMESAERIEKVSQELSELVGISPTIEEAKRIVALYKEGIKAILGDDAIGKIFHNVSPDSGALLQRTYSFLLAETDKKVQEIKEKSKASIDRYDKIINSLAADIKAN